MELNREHLCLSPILVRQEAVHARRVKQLEKEKKLLAEALAELMFLCEEEGLGDRSSMRVAEGALSEVEE
jgi:hypothetical protein